MVKLAEPAPIDNEKIQVACVSDEHVDLTTNSTCWTAGWGRQLIEEFELHTIKVRCEASTVASSDNALSSYYINEN